MTPQLDELPPQATFVAVHELGSGELADCFWMQVMLHWGLPAHAAMHPPISKPEHLSNAALSGHE